MHKYFLEYGRHDLDTGYNSIELAFDPEKTQTDVRSMNLVALRINTTHASILLQVNNEPTSRLRVITLPQLNYVVDTAPA